MSLVVTEDKRITKFCALVNQGMQAWVQAGALLCEIVRDDPMAVGRILRDNQHLTREILDTFQRIGRKEVLPILMVDNSPGARLLAGLPYEEQQRVYASTVKVAKQTKDGVIERRCHVSDLTAGEAKRVFDIDRVRSVKEQRELLRPMRTNNNSLPRNSDPDKVIAERAAMVEHELAVELDEPRTALQKALDAAHLALMKAREALNDIRSGSPFDSNITMALGAVGRLRFALNDRQI